MHQNLLWSFGETFITVCAGIMRGKPTTNFKQEMIELIGNHEVDEYHLIYTKDWSVSEDPIYKGKDKILWDEIQGASLSTTEAMALKTGEAG